MHGVTHTLDELRDRGVPGFEVEVVGTDHNVDRRLSAVAEIDIPFYAGLKVGVPSLPAIVEALADGRYDLVHLCSPGPVGRRRGAHRARDGRADPRQLPHRARRLRGPAHAGPAARGRRAAGDRRLLRPVPTASCRRAPRRTPSCARWGSPTSASAAGTAASTSRASPPRCARRDLLPGEITVLYAGRLTREKGADLLAKAFLQARERDPRLHLVLAGGGPEEHLLRARLGEHATFLGWLEGDALAAAYASADIFLFASRTDTFGQVLLEAQASGLPVVAVGEGGPASIVTDQITGRLCPADAGALADAVVELAACAGAARAARRATRCRRCRSARGSARCSASPTATAARWSRPPRRSRPAVPREAAVLEARRRLRGTATPRRARRAAVRAAPLRVADVALFYGERSGGIRTYLEAKAAWAQRSGLIEHHVIVPGPRERHEARPPRAAVPAAGGAERLPAAARRRRAEGHAARAAPRRRPPARPVLATARRRRRPRTTSARGRRRPPRLDRARRRRAARPGRALAPAPALVDAPRLPRRRRVMSAVDPRPDCGRSATIPLRFGIDAAFVPQPAVRRQDHVLYVGRLGREKGVVELLHAAARSAEPWQLKLVGQRPARAAPAAPRRAARHRRAGADVSVHRRPRAAGALVRERARRRHAGRARDLRPDAPFEAGGDRHARRDLLDRARRRRSCARSRTPTSRATRRAARRDRGRPRRPPAEAAGDALGRRCSWGAAFAAETVALERLVRGRSRRAGGRRPDYNDSRNASSSRRSRAGSVRKARARVRLAAVPEDRLGQVAGAAVVHEARVAVDDRRRGRCPTAAPCATPSPRPGRRAGRRRAPAPCRAAAGRCTGG